MFSYSVVIVYIFFFLILIFQYFCNKSFEISNKNLNIVSNLIGARVLTEQQLSPIIRSIRTSSDIPDKLVQLPELRQEALYDKLGKLSSNFTGDNTVEYTTCMSNKNMDIVRSLNTHLEHNSKAYLYNIFSLGSKLEKEFHLYSHDYYISEVMLNGRIFNTEPYTISELSSTFTPFSSTTSSSTSSSSITPATSTVSSLVNNNLSEIVTNFSSISTSLFKNLTTLTPSIETETIITSENNSSLLMPVEHSNLNKECFWFFCDPKNFIALYIPLVVVGRLLFFIYLYKQNTHTRPVSGKSNPKKDIGKRRTHKIDNGYNIHKHSEFPFMHPF
ncbi:PIR-like protein [Plasmodium gallinaceum]|uniref:PIR-like protein n=1 Tax=Plasmodium gallinaceum TaxID=5849 RepID=A0A1J1GT66_PLAGA|nr:PIR-like protein [Plasmodium gallinaceum]CRG95488.1 PIR-like protein [Plasmodium gallinaceum]